MATTKKRINISVSDEMSRILGKLAKRDQVPQATKAEHLIRIAIEIEEDEALGTLALSRDTASAKFVPHGKAWQ